MTWLLWLYPPAWRRRCGGELADVIATQRASFGNAIDLVAAAIDAWLNPQSSTAAAVGDAKGAGAMDFRMLQLRCAGYGPNVTSADARKAAAVTIFGTLALVLPCCGPRCGTGAIPTVLQEQLAASSGSRS